MPILHFHPAAETAGAAPYPPDSNPIPLLVRQLVANLRGSRAPLVRTAVLALGPAHYVSAAEQWATPLYLAPRHLALHIADRLEAQGHTELFLDPDELLRYALELLPTALTAADPTEPGTWVWGVDVLLARLKNDQRRAFWFKLLSQVSKRPPLLLVLPTTLLARFGPEQPSEWGGRFVQFP